jgi:signal transduction histidine kinase
MGDGGRLSLTAEFALLSARAAEPLGLEAGRYVIFDVADTGSGMTPEVLAKATEAFFTTKGAAGTGLGLAESAQFARESGGALSIRSRQGRWTTVSLYLPGVGATPKVCRLKARS